MWLLTHGLCGQCVSFHRRYTSRSFSEQVRQQLGQKTLGQEAECCRGGWHGVGNAKHSAWQLTIS